LCLVDLALMVAGYEQAVTREQLTTVRTLNDNAALKLL
jgi:hypothetical protein